MFTMGPPMWGEGGDEFAWAVRSLLHFNDANGTKTPVDAVPAGSLLYSGTNPTRVNSSFGKFGGSYERNQSCGLEIAGGLTKKFTAGGGATPPFTAELWVYIVDANPPFCGGLKYQRFMEVANDDASSSLALSVFETGQLLRGVFYGTTVSLGSISFGAWHHVAITYDGSVTRVFVDGSLAGLHTGTATIGNTNLSWSPGSSLINDNFWNGFVDEARLTWGVCRYTGAFTPPAAPYPNP